MSPALSSSSVLSLLPEVLSELCVVVVVCGGGGGGGEQIEYDNWGNPLPTASEATKRCAPPALLLSFIAPFLLIKKTRRLKMLP
jgi:hypothetical protein